MLLAIALTTPLCHAAEIVTLKDGRQVKLNDDFTWQYVQKDSDNKQAVIPVTAVPVIEKQNRYTTATLGEQKPTLQLTQSGVDVLLEPLRYQSGSLLIPTAITNQGTESVILVTIKITVADENGQILDTQSVNVWESIKRMASTYLRPKTHQPGRTISLPVKQLKHYKISASISAVTTR
nr:DUF3157 family protein [Vibrio sinus]